MWRKKKRGHDGPPAGDPPAADEFATGVGNECEAFLAGQLAGYFVRRGRPVPPVAWLNKVVHATIDELAMLAVGTTDVPQPATWRRAVGYLARTVFERARESSRSIDEIQRELLLPLELELIGNPESVGLDAADLIRLALARIYEQPELSA